MFEENSRIENKNGIYFFEEDVLLSKYVFNNDTWTRIRGEFNNGGFGIVVIPYDEQTGKMSERNYLTKVDNYKISTYINTSFSNIELKTQADNIPYDKTILVDFKIRGRKLSVHVNNVKKYEVDLPNSRRYKLGIYSDKFNKINSIDIKVPSPMNWNTNMKNTAGGLMKFIENGFFLEGCKRKAEIEQNNIELKKGSNYLTFERFGDVNDIEPYVFLEGDTRRDDDEKNILEKINDNKYKFVLEEDTGIVVKFRGKDGGIKNISISMNIEDSFAPTGEDNYSPGSKLIIKTKEIKTVFFKGIITGIPGSHDKYNVIRNKDKSLKMSDLDVHLNKEFTYIISKDGSVFKVDVYLSIKENTYNPIDSYKDQHPIKTVIMENWDEELTIFENLDGTINRMVYIIDNEDEDMVDVIEDKTLVYYIASESVAPIIVEIDGKTIDMSGAFRKKDNKYIFTNYEREVFESKRVIYVDKKMSEQDATVRIYKIPFDADINWDDLYTIKEEDNISIMTKQYTTVNESELDIEKETGRIVIPDHASYEYIVVDYLREDSYTINKLPNTNIYEVEISTTHGEDIEIFYEGKGYLDFESGKMSTGIIGEKKKYIVLNKFKVKSEEI